MKYYRVEAVIIRHYYEARRNLDRITDMVYWPILDVIVWGFFSVYLSSGKLGGTLANFLLGASILWGMFYGFQRDMAVGFLDELWSRNLINLFSTPLTVSEYVAGLVIINFLKVMVALLASALLAWALYAFNIFPFLPELLPFCAILMHFGLALGILITGMIFRYTTKIQGLAWSFAGLLMPVSCVFYPLASLPSWLQAISWMLPTSHAFEGMRQVLLGKELAITHVWWGLGLDVVYIALAVVAFRIVFEKARSRGLLVKLE
jgi:ABC-2 type transport system permease protein